MPTVTRRGLVVFGILLCTAACGRRQPVQISCDALANLLIERVEPSYPAEAIEIRQQALVVFDVVVNAEGEVSSAVVVTGPPLFRETAKRALLQWRYRPYLVDGEPVEVTTRLGLRFRLPDTDAPDRGTPVCRP